jgi:hypothetical protein
MLINMYGININVIGSKSYLFSEFLSNKIFETKNSDEILELKDYIKILEENVPQSKMKKINPSYKPIEPEVIKIQVADKSTTLDIIPFITESENSKDGSSF